MSSTFIATTRPSMLGGGSSKPSAGTPPGAPHASDERRASVRLTLPYRARAMGTIHDGTGESQSIEVSRVAGERSQVDLELRGGEVRVVEFAFEPTR